MPNKHGSVYKRYKFDPSYKKPRSSCYYKTKKRNKSEINVDLCTEATTSKEANHEIEQSTTQFSIDNQHVEENCCNHNQNEDVYSETFDNLLRVVEDAKDASGPPDKIEIACALLATFFAGKLTQHALTLVLKLFNVIVDNELPNNFDELSKLILKNNKDKIEYTKKWYCPACKKFVILENRFQRICYICKERFYKIFCILFA